MWDWTRQHIHTHTHTFNIARFLWDTAVIWNNSMHAKVHLPPKVLNKCLMPEINCFTMLTQAYTLLIVHEFVIIKWELNNQIKN